MEFCRIWLICCLRTFKEMLGNSSGLGIPNFHYEMIPEVKLIKEELIRIWLFITYMKSQQWLLRNVCCIITGYPINKHINSDHSKYRKSNELLLKWFSLRGSLCYQDIARRRLNYTERWWSMAFTNINISHACSGEMCLFKNLQNPLPLR